MLDFTKGDTQLIIKEGARKGLLRNQLAYVLATAMWETGHTMKPVKEAYWLSEDWRKKNLRYYPWYGRGYVQLTWEDNYKKAGNILNRDLTSNPDIVMIPEISAEILVLGSRDGWFRKGHNLSRYITLQKSDFFNAREIINGDKNYKKKDFGNKTVGNIIADYARQYDRYLKDQGYGVEMPVKAPVILPEPVLVDEGVLEPEISKQSPQSSMSLLELVIKLIRLFRKK